MSLMPIEHVPDWEKRLARQDAFWAGQIIDRPVVTFGLPKKQPDPAFPKPAPRQWPTLRDRWFDAEYTARQMLACVRSIDYYGDALPATFPNLGPEVFSAFFGMELEYGESTSWSIPNLEDWADVDPIRFSEDNIYFKTLNEMTDVMLEIGRGQFYVGLTDLHPGGDAIAAFRDPQDLALDMIEHVDQVKALLTRVNETYFKVYDLLYDRLVAAGQAISTWAGIVSTKKWYVPSNDFSCMVSREMFDDVFLPGIVEECRFLEASIYHLDGPGALQHLDSLLEIPELNAIQWVYGSGHGGPSDWMDVYKKCQAAGKGLQLGLSVDELDLFMDALRPEGLWIGLGGVKDADHAGAVLKKVASWT